MSVRVVVRHLPAITARAWKTSALMLVALPCVLLPSLQPAHANHATAANEMSISFVSGSSPIDAGGPAVVMTGGEFAVRIAVDTVPNPYPGYMWELMWMAALVEVANGAQELQVMFNLCDPPTLSTSVGVTTFGNGAGCWTNSPPTATYVGPVTEVSLRCISVGDALVALPGLDQDPAFGTTLLGDLPTTLEQHVENTLTASPPTVAGIVVRCADPSEPDLDDDGCTSTEEGGTDARLGGQRDFYSHWDFFDTQTPPLSPSTPNGTKDGAVTLLDVLNVLNWSGAVNDMGPNGRGFDYDADADGDSREDGSEYDRAASTDAMRPWLSGAPSGSVTLSDALVALAQVGHTCLA